MAHVDGFQTTDSFRFDRTRSSSSMSLSSSSGYGSRLSLSPGSSHQRRLALSKYFKEKLSKHKSLASLLLTSSPRISTTVEQNEQIYEHVWNLDEQIEKFRSQITEQISHCDQNENEDRQSVISMSVDPPPTVVAAATTRPINRFNDDELLSAAAWYQEGLPRQICEEYLIEDQQPIGSFLLRRSYTHHQCPFVLSIRTRSSTVEHFLIERLNDQHEIYRLQGSSKCFDNLSTLVLHHTVIPDILPVTLLLPSSNRTSIPTPRIRSARF